jgi:hypothetical protein
MFGLLFLKQATRQPDIATKTDLINKDCHSLNPPICHGSLRLYQEKRFIPICIQDDINRGILFLLLTLRAVYPVTICFHSICELALSLRQHKLAKTRPGRWHITVHRQGPKQYSMFAARNSIPL